MAKPIAAGEAKQLQSKHRTALDRLQAFSAKADKQAADIRTAAQQLAGEQVVFILKETPVEELNRDKQGIRVKALKEQGYHTIYDLDRATMTGIAAVKGISEDTARDIKKRVSEMKTRASAQAKLKLNADLRTPLSTRLVTGICAYKSELKRIETCRKLLDAYKGSIERALSDLAPATGGLKWSFASEGKKQNAVAAYEYLSAMEHNGYMAQCDEVFAKRLKGVLPSPNAAWDDFIQDPIPYTTVLEQLCPTLADTDAGMYGLPEELAEAVFNEPLILNGLYCTLRRYQEWGVKYILHQKRVLLGDEMGLGKTVQAIAAMVSLCNNGGSHFMVVCPASVLSNWYREIKKHSGLDAIKIHGDGREEEFQQWIERGGVGVTTFETTGFLKMQENFRFSMLIVDEAHYIKNPEARRTINTKAICAHADRALFMTGTALENNVDEMLTLINILNPAIAQTAKGLSLCLLQSNSKNRSHRSITEGGGTMY